MHGRPNNTAAFIMQKFAADHCMYYVHEYFLTHDHSNGWRIIMLLRVMAIREVFSSIRIS